MAKDLTPTPLTFSTSLRETLEILGDGYGDKVARKLIYRRGWYDFRTDPLCHTHAAFGDYISINADGELTYLPAARAESALAQGIEWQKKMRQAGRPARVARSLLTPEVLELLTDADFENFTNNLRAKAKRDQMNVRVVSGEDIRYWYHEDRIASGTGTLRTSCMRHEDCQEYMDFYVNNPDAINMLIMTNGVDRLLARALLWNTVECGWVLDRIYGNDIATRIMREWAAERGYPTRHFNSYEKETLWDVPGEMGEQLFLSVNLVTGSSRGYPYCDTFKYLFVDEDAATIRVKNHQRGAHCTYELVSTTGQPYIVSCDACGGDFDRSNLRDGLCYDCRTATLCVACEHYPRSSGPDGSLCVRCADQYRCPACREYRTDQSYSSPTRRVYHYPSYYRGTTREEPVCSECYQAWLTTQECALCHTTDLDMNSAIPYGYDLDNHHLRRVVCHACYAAHACVRCGEIDEGGLVEVRFYVDHAFRDEYTERQCRQCQGLRCSYCSKSCYPSERCTDRGEGVFECGSCRIAREHRESRRLRNQTDATPSPEQDAPVTYTYRYTGTVSPPANTFRTGGWEPVFDDTTPSYLAVEDDGYDGLF